MAKDAYWFKHDANAAFDPKLLRIRAIFGWEGYGVYFGVLEFMRQQNGYKCLKNDSEITLLATLLNIDFSRFKNIIVECKKVGLFEENEDYFFSKSLIYRMKEWEKQKKNGSKPKHKPNSKPNDKPTTKPKVKPNGSIRGEEIREEEKDSYAVFVSQLNSELNREFRGDSKSERQFNARLKDGYTVEEIMCAVRAAKANPFHVETNFQHLTPDFFTRADKIDRYRNVVVEQKVEEKLVRAAGTTDALFSK